MVERKKKDKYNIKIALVFIAFMLVGFSITRKK